MQTPGTDRDYFLKILEKYSAGTASPDEQAFVEKYYNLLQNDPNVLDTMTEQEKNSLQQEIKNRLMEAVQEDNSAPVYSINYTKKHGMLRKLVAAAAVIIVITAAALIYFMNNTKQPSQPLVDTPTKKQQPEKFEPGSTKATLVLANGDTIVLDDAANGNLATQNNTKVIKLNEGALSYSPDGKETPASVAFNTIATPRGGEYEVILPDGTRAWLNAASYLKFPVAFGKERMVEMGGEVYFEVAKDKERPFKVMVNGTTVQALGTHFNINAYAEELTQNTTLLEGSVRVVNGNDVNILQPGEQAQVAAGHDMKVIKNVNQSEVMAWRNGLFSFNKVDIRSFMRQLERWYDIHVQYEGPLPDLRFNGKMERNLNWNQLLKILKEMGVNYRVNGRTLVVSR